MSTAVKGVASAVMGAVLVIGAAAWLPRGGARGAGERPLGTQATSAALLEPAPALGSLEASIEVLQARVRADASDWRSSALLGMAYVTEARITADPAWYAKAEGVLRTSLRLRPEGNVEAQLGLGALALARHDFEGALERGRAARSLDAFDADARGLIGDALVELGRYDRAVRAYQAMVDMRPDLASYARASYAMELAGRVRPAIVAMEMAFDAAGGPSDAAWAAHQLGELGFGRGRNGDAAGWYRRGLELDPSSVPNLAGLAKVAWARGDTQLAIERYREVVERSPSVEYVAALGDLYATTGRDELSDEQYAVVEAIRTIARDNGVNVDLEIALFDADHGEPERALAAAEAEWARRTSVHVADAYAWALYANGRYEQAARLSRRALALGTRSPSFLFHAGLIQRALGHDVAAGRLLRRAIAINPSFSILHSPTAIRVLAELEASA